MRQWSYRNVGDYNEVGTLYITVGSTPGSASGVFSAVVTRLTCQSNCGDANNSWYHWGGLLITIFSNGRGGNSHRNGALPRAMVAPGRRQRVHSIAIYHISRYMAYSLGWGGIGETWEGWRDGRR